MYKAAVRAMMKRNIKQLNDGNVQALLRLASPDFELTFPGDNSWSTMFRPAVKGRHGHVTHRGIEEGTAFADRFVKEGVQYVIEDILVNGPPWNTRVALRAHVFIPGENDGDVYNNRVVSFLTVRWGRLIRWETYEDTQRTSAWDEAITAKRRPRTE